MEYKYTSTLSLSSALDGDGWSMPLLLYPRERPGNRGIGGWVGPRACLDGCGKSRLQPGFDPQTVQPVVELLVHADILNTSFCICTQNPPSAHVFFLHILQQYPSGFCQHWEPQLGHTDYGHIALIRPAYRLECC